MNTTRAKATACVVTGVHFPIAPPPTHTRNCAPDVTTRVTCQEPGSPPAHGPSCAWPLRRSGPMREPLLGARAFRGPTATVTNPSHPPNPPPTPPPPHIMRGGSGNCESVCGWNSTLPHPDTCCLRRRYNAGHILLGRAMVLRRGGASERGTRQEGVNQCASKPASGALKLGTRDVLIYGVVGGGLTARPTHQDFWENPGTQHCPTPTGGGGGRGAVGHPPSQPPQRYTTHEQSCQWPPATNPHNYTCLVLLKGSMGQNGTRNVPDKTGHTGTHPPTHPNTSLP